jgi:hypothetical protein
MLNCNDNTQKVKRSFDNGKTWSDLQILYRGNSSNSWVGKIDKWYLGGEISFDNYYLNECQPVELLPNTNSIFLNARSYSTVRIVAYSSDGGKVHPPIHH